MKTAIVIGATGLVGSRLLKLLLTDERFRMIKVFTRRQTEINSEKLEEHIIDFDNIRGHAQLITGDVLFSSLGTTIKKAGSKKEQYKIDYTYQYEFAKAASSNGVGAYVLVSSMNANPGSNIFYTRMKGELDRDAKLLPFSKIGIIKPGILSGIRIEKRTMEKYGIAVLKTLSELPGLKKYKPIDAGIVAQAMINAYFNNTEKIKEYELKEVLTLSGIQD